MSLYKRSKTLRSLPLWAALILVLLLASCGGLSGEPAIVATLPPQPTPIPEPNFPVTPPDVALGAEIFTARCSRCHGLTGQGDGELIGPGEQQIANAPRDFTDPATTQGLTPAQWFGTITNGRMDRFMPPWRDELTADQRWAVAMYTFTMSYTADQLASGAVLFDQYRDQASTLLHSLEQMAQLTDAQIATEVGASDLSSEDQQAVVRFMRVSSLVNADVIGAEIVSQPAATPEVGGEPAVSLEPAVTAEVVTGPVTGTVTGFISNGTAGGDIPAGLVVNLHILDMSGTEDVREAPVSDDGGYVFSDVPIQDDRGYYVTTTYQGYEFGSDLNFGDPTLGTLELPLVIYEATSDPSGVVITGMVNQISARVDGLQVALIIRFENLSDRVYITDEAVGDNLFASVKLTLPPGAEAVDTGQPERYIVSGNPPTVTDTAPVIPGSQHIFHAIFAMPYDGHLAFDLPLPYRIDGPIQLLISPSSVKATSDQLLPLDSQEVSGVLYDRYGVELTADAGDSLRFTLDGVASDTAATTTTTTTTPAAITAPRDWLPVALAAIGVAVIGLGVFFYWRDRQNARSQGAAVNRQLQEALLEQIAELDRAYEAGEINKKTYKKLREPLKERLGEVLKD